MQKMTAPSKMGRKHKLNLISHTVGRWLAAAVRLLLIYDNLRITANRKVKSAPSSGNIFDRRLWRIKGASVGAAVDFVRRSKPHKQNRDTARGQ